MGGASFSGEPHCAPFGIRFEDVEVDLCLKRKGWLAAKQGASPVRGSEVMFGSGCSKSGHV